MPSPALTYHDGLAAPSTGSPAALCGTLVSPQISSSFVFVPELSPRETKCARPAAPAAAIASSAPTASERARRHPRGIVGRADDHEVVPGDQPPERLQ